MFESWKKKPKEEKVLDVSSEETEFFKEQGVLEAEDAVVEEVLRPMPTKEEMAAYAQENNTTGQPATFVGGEGNERRKDELPEKPANLDSSDGNENAAQGRASEQSWVNEIKEDKAA